MLSDIEACQNRRQAYDFADEYLSGNPSRQELISYLGNPKQEYISVVLAAMSDREYPLDMPLAGVVSSYLYEYGELRTPRTAALAMSAGGDDSRSLLFRLLPGLYKPLREDLCKLFSLIPGV